MFFCCCWVAKMDSRRLFFENRCFSEQLFYYLAKTCQLSTWWQLPRSHVRQHRLSVNASKMCRSWKTAKCCMIFMQQPVKTYLHTGLRLRFIQKGYMIDIKRDWKLLTSLELSRCFYFDPVQRWRFCQRVSKQTCGEIWDEQMGPAETKRKAETVASRNFRVKNVSMPDWRQ